MKLSNLLIAHYASQLAIKESDLFIIHENDNLTTTEKMKKVDHVLGEIVTINQKLETYQSYLKSKDNE